MTANATLSGCGAPEPEETGRFTPEQFTVLDPEQGVLGCPAGQQTRQRRRNAHDTGWKYHFPGKMCAGCPLREACMGGQPNKSGRTVIKNDYEAEYRAARQRARTPEHEQVRRQHRRVERKLAELVRRHGGRRARYRGGGRVLVQYLLSAVVMNVKRMVRLLRGDGARVAVAGACC